VGGREVRIARGPALPREHPQRTDSTRIRTSAMTTVTSGPDADAANNDYRRIQNAIDVAMSGDTITLAGTFDFGAPFAATAWALGDDGMPGTNDDYSVYVPAGKNNITLTATSLGSATIQGPGDLPAANLEGVFVFDGGPNQGWTISNLRILDFDLSIGFFNGAGGVTAFNNTVIQNNFIRVATDLNATVAPMDVNQNIGIHFSFGTNQSINGNLIHILGDGISNGANFSSDVGMQSNTSGGSVYDGLSIANNSIHILNAQSATPESILGIWENSHAHSSNITVSGNSFVNDAAGNNPATNLQRAFRVTSHSGAMSTVTYSLNSASGPNIGFQWISGSNFAGNQAIRMTANTVTNADTGVLVQSNGIAHFEDDTITGSGSGGGLHVITGTLTGAGANPNGVFHTFVSGGSGDGIVIDATAGAIAPLFENNLGNNAGFGLHNLAAPSITADRNWWGSNLAANVAAEISGNATFTPWLASGTDVNGLPGFQPFIYATTTGTLTTFAGTAAADTGALLAGSPLTTMIMDGDTATTLTAELLQFDILPGASDDLFTLGQTGIPTTFDGGPGNDTLIGTNVAQTWNVTGAGSGNIPGAANSFTNVEALRGGTAADSFVFGAAGSIALTVDGNLGVDTLNNSAIPAATITPTGPGTLDGFMGTATGIGIGFDNINLIAASPADLVVTKSGPATANVNAAISYTIGVANNGPNAAINVQLTDNLPPGTTFVSLSSPAGWSCTTPAVGSGGTVTCSILSLPVGPNPFTLNVNAPAMAGMITNTATVTSANEGMAGNESAGAGTTITGPTDLAITKIGPASAPTGGPIPFTITVTNNGSSSATNVTVTDTLPAGVTFGSVTPSQGSCMGTTTVTCNLGTIPGGGSATIALVVNDTAPGGTISNTASVTGGQSDPVPGNNSSTANVLIIPVGGIPMNSGWALLALATLLAMLGTVRIRM
ncbi:MAG: hypothetical protein JWO56_106, partial [Acidobacteria bacterium]|nr:hypothetical protein [Acidobacteriota bacterium]